ncbi:MAG: universal stress protein [Dehalococcoidia bacterium]|nr:universal stress protein [Dehalococcoidia bacterium]
MYKKMLVPIDGSMRSEVVVPHAAATAKALGCNVRLLTVVDLSKNGNGKNVDSVGDEAASVAWIEAQIEQAESYMHPVAERFADHGLRAEMEVRFGSPGEEIIKAATEYGSDIIAMATRSRRGLARLMFGSVADEVLRESHVPVLLITAA